MPRATAMPGAEERTLSHHPQTRRDLAWLLAPCQLESFFDEHFERRMLHLAARDSHYYDPIFSAAALEQVIHQGRAGCSLVRSGRKVAQQPGRDLAARLEAGYRSGATVVIDRVQEAWLPLHRLLRQIEESLLCPVSANLYLTPAHKKGFAAHIDSHDTLILQIEGCKHWRLYQERPVDAVALAEARELIAGGDAEALESWLGEPERQLELRAGEALYMPRGVFHEAAAGERASMHLTIGWSPYAYEDLLTDLVRRAAENDPDLQRSVPRSAGRRPHADLRQKVTELLTDLPRRLDIDQLLESRDRLFVHGLERLPIGAFANLPDPQAPDQAVARREGFPCYLWRDDSGCGLGFPGGSLHGPSRLEPALRHVAEADASFHAADLPGPLTDQGKVRLVERLLDEGLLTRVGRP